MVKSPDIARGHQAVEEDRIRRAVRQHEAQQRATSLKKEILPGIIAFLGGWSLMSGLNNILKDRK
jgi:hypothetical protein